MKNAAVALEGYATDQNGTYTGLNGLNEDSASSRREGFRLRVGHWPVTNGHEYCIQGESVNLPGQTFVYTSTSGTVQIGPTGTTTC